LFHREHFTCKNCQRPLNTESFFERDGEVYCDKCFNDHFAPKCAYCDGPIHDTCVTALGKTWHADHFFCSQCGKSFPDGTPQSAAGGRARTIPRSPPRHVSGVDLCVGRGAGLFHDPGKFMENDGKAYCEEDYQNMFAPKCSQCDLAVMGECITALNGKWHAACFVCQVRLTRPPAALLTSPLSP